MGTIIGKHEIVNCMWLHDSCVLDLKIAHNNILLLLIVFCTCVIAFVLKPFGNDGVIFLMKTNTTLRPISMKKKNQKKINLKVLLILFIV